MFGGSATTVTRKLLTKFTVITILEITSGKFASIYLTLNLFQPKLMEQFKPRAIKFLNPMEFKVLKVIQIQGPNSSWFTGYLPYLRAYKGGEYTRESNDIVDQKILDVVKQSLPDSFLRYSIDILFEGQLKENLKAIEGASRKNITIQFNPLLPFDITQYIEKEFYAYPLNFTARMLFSKEQDKGHYINDYVLCYLPHDQLEELVKTIKAV